MIRRIALVSLFLVPFYIGCGEKEASSPETPSSAAQPAPEAAAPAPAPTTGGAPQQPAAGGMYNQGHVLTVQQAGGYTYIEVDVHGKGVWLAASRANARPGQLIHWGDYAVMRNFESKALGRVFDVILFVDSVSLVGQGTTAQAPAAATSGEVLAVMHSGGYSYLEVKQGEGSIWLAAPQAKVEVGNSVSWSGGAPMNGFRSETLGRTFDEIIFVGGVSVQ